MISQSLIKDIIAYEKEQVCGNILKHKYIESKSMPCSDVMNQGHYFEYVATGALPKDGKVPQPEMLKTSKRLWTKAELMDFIIHEKFPGKIKTPPLGLDQTIEGSGDEWIEAVIKSHQDAVQVASMTSDYQRAWKQAQEFKRLIKEMGIEIISVQERKVKDGLEATRDIHFKWTKGERKGQEGTIDLKYSGLIHNEFESFGWAGLINYNSERFGHRQQMLNHKKQSLQYEYVFEMPFYYWVFSSSSGAEETGENIFVEMISDEFEVEQHLNLAKETSSKFNALSKLGFEPYPEYNRCKSCELFDQCKDKDETPKAIQVHITTD